MKINSSYKLKYDLFVACLSISVLLISLLACNVFHIAYVQGQSFAANMTSLINNGNTLASKGNYNGAIAMYNQVLERDPNNIKALYDKGKALTLLAKFAPSLNSEAIATYDKILSLDPNNIGALYNRGNDLAKLGNYNGAIANYDKILSLDPNNIGALYGKANALAKLGNYNASTGYYNKILSINATNTKALKSEASIKAKLNK